MPSADEKTEARDVKWLNTIIQISENAEFRIHNLQGSK